MTPEEKNILITALETINDPRGNWEYGWELLCQLAQLDPQIYKPPFRTRTDEELRRRGEGEPQANFPPRQPPA